MDTNWSIFFRPAAYCMFSRTSSTGYKHRSSMQRQSATLDMDHPNALRTSMDHAEHGPLAGQVSRRENAGEMNLGRSTACHPMRRGVGGPEKATSVSQLPFSLWNASFVQVMGAWLNKPSLSSGYWGPPNPPMSCGPADSLFIGETKRK